MKPEQKIKWAILAKVALWDDAEAPKYPCENVDELYDQLVKEGAHWDAKSEVREGEESTSVKCESSRHYESKAVAMQFPDKSWVGWTYWYGGGKHGEPEAIDWMEDAYDLNCQEQEKVVIVRSFKKVSP